MKFVDKIRKFMYGRYGIDELYNFLFKLYIVLLIIDLFINSYVLAYIELIIVVIMLYRLFSKNISKRREENKKFLKLRKRIIKPFKSKIKQIKDKNNIYKKCSKCKMMLRLPVPNKRGIKHVKCPKCKRKLTVLVLKREKIEVIKPDKGKRGKK